MRFVIVSYNMGCLTLVWDPVNRLKYTSGMKGVSRIERYRSDRNRFVIEMFGGIFVLPLDVFFLML